MEKNSFRGLWYGKTSWATNFFMALSCADLQWDKLVFIIGKLKGKRLTSERISSMDYFERCGYLNFIQFYLHVNFSLELKPSLKWSIS